LVHFVGAAIHEFVLVWFGVAREHAFEFHGLSCDHLRLDSCQVMGEGYLLGSEAGDLAIGYAP
jgi:hypothetical protein